MTNNTKIDSQNNINIFLIITVAIILGLFVWLLYSFYGFWKNMQAQPTNITAESYIDKAGLDQVKLKLEDRK